MPRIGLAYRLSEKTVIRTGYGIYYNVHQLNNYTILNLNPPLSGSAAFSNTAANGVITNSNPITSPESVRRSQPNQHHQRQHAQPGKFRAAHPPVELRRPAAVALAVGAGRQLRGQQGRPHRQHGRVQQPRPGPEFAAHHATTAPAVPVRDRRPRRPGAAAFAHPLARFRRQFLVSRLAGQLPEALQPAA